MKIHLFGTRYCSYCRAARRLLQKRGLAFEDIPLDTDPELRKRIRDRSRRYTVPQIWIDEVHVGGYHELLSWDNAGKLIEVQRGSQ